MKNAIEWLYACGWAGWLEDQITGEIFTHHGDEFRDAAHFKRWLSDLPRWPRVLNGCRKVPKLDWNKA